MGQLHEGSWMEERLRQTQRGTKERRGGRQGGRPWNHRLGWGLKGRPRMLSSGRWAWPILGTQGWPGNDHLTREAPQSVQENLPEVPKEATLRP